MYIYNSHGEKNRTCIEFSTSLKIMWQLIDVLGKNDPEKLSFLHKLYTKDFITVWEWHWILVLGLVPPRKNSIAVLLYCNLVFVNTSTKLLYSNSSRLFFLGGNRPSTNIWCRSPTVFIQFASQSAKFKHHN